LFNRLLNLPFLIALRIRSLFSTERYGTRKSWMHKLSIRAFAASTHQRKPGRSQISDQFANFARHTENPSFETNICKRTVSAHKTKKGTLKRAFSKN
jgi:hypothetical protein